MPCPELAKTLSEPIDVSAASLETWEIDTVALVRRDQTLLAGVDWHRVVLDEAQNIKNPRAD
jgi:SNF2 family DNA or RNA helicase